VGDKTSLLRSLCVFYKENSEWNISGEGGGGAGG
jgi:hypothetical protein